MVLTILFVLFILHEGKRQVQFQLLTIFLVSVVTKNCVGMYLNIYSVKVACMKIQISKPHSTAPADRVLISSVRLNPRQLRLSHGV